ncbi:MAG: rhomboid family intramembrane serine protease [Alphaproteobacteria bacterium]|nr:rhomboid family intramembrane serine protease [Alphaproteobacteria bacterium]
MIPIHDDNPTTRSPILTLALIAACIGAFVWLMSLGPGTREWAAYTLGMVPAVLTGRIAVEPFLQGFRPELSVVTLMFLHGGWLHLGGNMLYLWIFGNNVEDRLGHGRFLALYLLAGLVGTAVHVASDPASGVPLVGASGAISGVLGAYLLLYPFARVRMIVPPFLFRTFKVPAWLFLGFWFVFQGIQVAGGLGQDGRPTLGEAEVAWSAHVGGFVAGMALLLLLRPRGVPLFTRPGQPARRGAVAAPWGGRTTRPTTRAAKSSSGPPTPARAVTGAVRNRTIDRTGGPSGRTGSRIVSR